MELVRLTRSRAVAVVGYDPESRVLVVRLRHGGSYRYFDISQEIYQGLLTDAHPWTVWGKEIKEHRWIRDESVPGGGVGTTGRQLSSSSDKPDDKPDQESG